MQNKQSTEKKRIPSSIVQKIVMLCGKQMNIDNMYQLLYSTMLRNVNLMISLLISEYMKVAKFIIIVLVSDGKKRRAISVLMYLVDYSAF